VTLREPEAAGKSTPVRCDDVAMDVSTLSDQAWQRGRLSLSARVRRLRAKAWMIGQCAVAAGVAWLVARYVFDHPAPFFAPVSAVVCLGTSYGQRLRRVAEVSIGVSIGIGTADLFTRLVGHGAWQISLIVAVAMSAAVLLDAGVLLINQAAVQSIVVTALPLNGGGSRLIDALIGGGVALVAATVVPGAPLRRPREAAAKVTTELARLIRSARSSAREVDRERAADTLDRARETESSLNELRIAASEGLEVVRSSPFRVRNRPQVRSIAEVVDPLDRALRDTRVMIRRIEVSARLDETMPPDYLEILDKLADAADAIARELAADRSPEAALPLLVEIATVTADASAPLTLSAAVVLGQMRSLVVDLLELAGLRHDEAVSTVPPRP
jgi:uncharacterized membrane protein YgaE (UPF0421/DUF939 family)